MAEMDEARWCAVNGGLLFTQRELAKFDVIVRQVEQQMLSWLRSELSHRQLLSAARDVELWNSVISELIARIKAGEHWEETPAF